MSNDMSKQIIADGSAVIQIDLFKICYFNKK